LQDDTGGNGFGLVLKSVKNFAFIFAGGNEEYALDAVDEGCANANTV